MRLDRVVDIATEDIRESSYDLAVFSNGYEARSTFLAKKYPEIRATQKIVFSFEENADNDQRRKNDKFYSNLGWEELRLSMHDEGRALEYFRSHLIEKDSVSILVDYSSMSRIWYVALLNLLRYNTTLRRATVDFVYAPGNHIGDTRPMVIRDFLCLPGFEGVSVPTTSSICVLGLGFEGSAALCVVDRLEPDYIYVYLASPGSRPKYVDRAKTTNAELMKYANKQLWFPLESVETVFKNLAEMISVHSGRASMTFVPMGPKTHVLATILACIRFPEVACLRVSGSRISAEQVQAVGRLVSTRIVFEQPWKTQIDVGHGVRPR